MRNDLLADVLSAIKNAEFVGKQEVIVPASNVVREVLRVMQEKSYIGDYEYLDNGRGGLFKVKLIGRITGCGAIKPRHSVKLGNYVKWEKRFLPSRNFGALVISTSKGIMNHEVARESNVGGLLLAYVY